VPHRLRDPRRAQQARAVEDEGDMQGGLVGEDAVGLLAVLTPRLAMIAGQDQEGAAVPASGEERSHQRLEGQVGGGHLSRVGVPRVAAGEGLGRPVGKVRLVEVDPQEGRGSPGPTEPLQRGRHRLPTRPLLLPPAHSLVPAQKGQPEGDRALGMDCRQLLGLNGIKSPQQVQLAVIVRGRVA